MGDILISSGIPNNDQFNVPTAGNVSNTGLNRSLVELRQKLTVVTNNLAVGWAGNKIAAETVIKELMDSCKRTEITRTSLVDFMNSLDDVRKRNLWLVGLLLENDAIEAFRSANCERFTSSFGEIGTAGSGVEDLKKFISGFEPPIYTESFNPWVKSIAIFMGISTYMLGREFLSLDALTQRFYGGGFELVFLEGGSFKKYEDISYLFWEASENESGWHISLPSALAKYSYHNDILLIRTIKLEGGDSESPSAKPISNSIHVVPPVYRRITDD